MRILFLIALLFALAAPAAAEEVRHAPQRIVSLNLCTDQLLLALADPGQIVALSRFATDARLSFAADQAVGFATLPAAAEAVIALDPDLILTGRFTSTAAKQMLARFDYRVEEVPFVRTLEEARESIRLVAQLVGQAARGEALVAAIDAALQEVKAEDALSALLIQRRGYTTGTASLTGDLLAALGIRLASDDLVGARGGFADLETIIAAQPDVLITASLATNDEDQGAALLAHRAIAERYPPSRRMALPERLTLCAGPSLIEAARHIARERDAALQRLAGG